MKKIKIVSVFISLILVALLMCFFIVKFNKDYSGLDEDKKISDLDMDKNNNEEYDNNGENNPTYEEESSNDGSNEKDKTGEDDEKESSSDEENDKGSSDNSSSGDNEGDLSQDDDINHEDKPTEDEKKEVDFSKLNYLALGDSITYGFDSTRGGLKMENPYPDLVGDILGLNAVYNYGISGSTLTSIEPDRYPFLHRYPNMTNDADIVSVMGGVNDYMRSVAELGTLDSEDSNTIYGALNLLCKGLKEKYRGAYIFFMTPYKYSRDPGVNTKGYSMEDICTAIKEVCSKYNIDVLDMYNEGQFEHEMYNLGSDGIHPSQAFFEQYTAPQIAYFIKNNYK